MSGRKMSRGQISATCGRPSAGLHSAIDHSELLHKASVDAKRRLFDVVLQLLPERCFLVIVQLTSDTGSSLFLQQSQGPKVSSIRLILINCSTIGNYGCLFLIGLLQFIVSFGK